MTRKGDKSRYDIITHMNSKSLLITVYWFSFFLSFFLLILVISLFDVIERKVKSLTSFFSLCLISNEYSLFTYYSFYSACWSERSGLNCGSYQDDSCLLD